MTGDDGYVLDHSTESYEEWRSDDEEREEGKGQSQQAMAAERGSSSEGRKGKEKKRKSLGEEMYVREDGLLLFGMVNQPAQQSTPTESHHSVLSALYRPEYLQSPSSLSSSQPTNSPTTATPGASSVGNRNSKNRIVVSKSQRGSSVGGGGQESRGSSESMHSSLRI